LQILFQRRCGFGAVRSLALLASFPSYENPALGHVEVVEIEADQFADPETAAIEKFE
jgi:hypothetical protein